MSQHKFGCSVERLRCVLRGFPDQCRKSTAEGAEDAEENVIAAQLASALVRQLEKLQGRSYDRIRGSYTHKPTSHTP